MAFSRGKCLPAPIAQANVKTSTPRSEAVSGSILDAAIASSFHRIMRLQFLSSLLTLG
jgi:hypothetical protein